MPTYSYRCTECDNAFDIHQAFTDDSLTECPVCGGRLRKVFSAVGVSFNGSGFYRNDSRAPRSEGGSSDGSSEKSGGKSDSGSPGKSGSTEKSGGASDGGGSSSGSGSGSGSGSTGSGSRAPAASAPSAPKAAPAA